MTSFQSVFASLAALVVLLQGYGIHAQVTSACDASILLQDTSAPSSGTLEDSGYTVTIGNNPLSPDMEMNFTAGLPQIIELSATTKNFRGFLISISDGTTDTAMYLNAAPMDTDVEVSSACSDLGVGAVTNTNDSEKNNITAILLTEFALEAPLLTSYTLNVSVVIDDGGDGAAEWYNSQFTINSLVPPAQNPPCPICGEDGMLVDPDKSTDLPAFPPLLTSPITISCGDLNDFTNAGVVQEGLCANFQRALGNLCGCETVSAPTSATAPADTPAPTPEGSTYPGPETSGTSRFTKNVGIVALVLAIVTF